MALPVAVCVCTYAAMVICEIYIAVAISATYVAVVVSITYIAVVYCITYAAVTFMQLQQSVPLMLLQLKCLGTLMTLDYCSIGNNSFYTIFVYLMAYVKKDPLIIFILEGPSV